MIFDVPINIAIPGCAGKLNEARSTNTFGMLSGEKLTLSIREKLCVFVFDKYFMGFLIMLEKY